MYCTVKTAGKWYGAHPPHNSYAKSVTHYKCANSNTGAFLCGFGPCEDGTSVPPMANPPASYSIQHFSLSEKINFLMMLKAEYFF